MDVQMSLDVPHLLYYKGWWCDPKKPSQISSCRLRSWSKLLDFHGRKSGISHTVCTQELFSRLSRHLSSIQ